MYSAVQQIPLTNKRRQALDIGGINFNLYAGILLMITLVYRFLLYVVLLFKQR